MSLQLTMIYLQEWILQNNYNEMALCKLQAFDGFSLRKPFAYQSYDFFLILSHVLKYNTFLEIKYDMVYFKK